VNMPMHMRQLPGYAYPNEDISAEADSALIPKTLEDVTYELREVVGALFGLQYDVAQRAICPKWAPYRACIAHWRRRQYWFSSWQNRFREIHRPTVPRFDGQSVTSFAEKAFALCGERMQWLNEVVAGVPVDRTLSVYSQDVVVGTLLFERSEYIYQHWPFDEIATDDLAVGIELECSWQALPPETGGTEARKACVPIADLPKPSDVWEFEPGLFRFRGRQCDLQPTPLLILRGIVSSKCSSFRAGDLKKMIDDACDIEVSTLKTHLSCLRRALRQITDDRPIDPIPYKAGAWRFTLPRIDDLTR
jgi:hypothetical protein